MFFSDIGKKIISIGLPVLGAAVESPYQCQSKKQITGHEYWHVQEVIQAAHPAALPDF